MVIKDPGAHAKYLICLRHHWVPVPLLTSETTVRGWPGGWTGVQHRAQPRRLFSTAWARHGVDPHGVARPYPETYSMILH